MFTARLILVALLRLSLLCAIAAPVIWASEVQAQKVGDIGFVASGDGELNVRSGPSTDRQIKYVLRNGDRVKVLKRSGKWGLVSYTTTASGWVYMPLVNFADDPRAATLRKGQTAFVCNAGSKITNVRYGPSSQDYGVITALRNGHKVTVQGTKTNPKGYIYYEVIFQYPGESKRSAGYIYYKALKTRCNGVSAPKPKKKTTTASSSGPKSTLTLTNGDCVVVVASRQTAREVLKFFKAMDTWDDHFRDSRLAYLSSNGWYAITIGKVNANKFRSGFKERLIRNSRWMSNDITCSTRSKFVNSYNATDLEREVRFASKRSESMPLRAAPPLKPAYRFDMREDSEADIKADFETFAKMWTFTQRRKITDAVREVHRTKVTTQRNTPKGMDWCQFKITTEQETIVNGYSIQKQTSTVYGDAAAIGEMGMGTSEERTKIRKRWAIYVADIFALNVNASDDKTQPGYTRGSCTSRLSKGFYDRGHSECIKPTYRSKNDENIQKRWRALQSYYLGCTVPVGVNKAMQIMDDIKTEKIDALVKANRDAEDKLRPALEAHKGKTLRLDGMGLRDVAGLVEWKYLENLYLRNNAIEDISFLDAFNKLKILDLSNNQISDVSVLLLVPELTSLNLANNNITDVRALARLRGIKAINLKGNPVFDLSPIQGLIDDPAVTVLTD